jgi:hypothetical protein
VSSEVALAIPKCAPQTFAGAVAAFEYCQRRRAMALVAPFQTKHSQATIARDQTIAVAANVAAVGAGGTANVGTVGRRESVDTRGWVETATFEASSLGVEERDSLEEGASLQMEAFAGDETGETHSVGVVPRSLGNQRVEKDAAAVAVDALDASQ